MYIRATTKPKKTHHIAVLETVSWSRCCDLSQTGRPHTTHGWPQKLHLPSNSQRTTLPLCLLSLLFSQLSHAPELATDATGRGLTGDVVLGVDVRQEVEGLDRVRGDAAHGLARLVLLLRSVVGGNRQHRRENRPPDEKAYTIKREMRVIREKAERGRGIRVTVRVRVCTLSHVHMTHARQLICASTELSR